MTPMSRIAGLVILPVLYLAACGVSDKPMKPGASAGAPAPWVSNTDAPQESPGANPAGAAAETQIRLARTMLAGVPIGGRGPRTGYERTQMFGGAWLDVDRNGCDTRDDVLRRDLRNIRTRGTCK